MQKLPPEYTALEESGPGLSEMADNGHVIAVADSAGVAVVAAAAESAAAVTGSAAAAAVRVQDHTKALYAAAAAA